MIHSCPLVQPLRAFASGKLLSLLPKQLKSSFEEERESKSVLIGCSSVVKTFVLFQQFHNLAMPAGSLGLRRGPRRIVGHFWFGANCSLTGDYRLRAPKRSNRAASCSSLKILLTCCAMAPIRSRVGS